MTAPPTPMPEEQKFLAHEGVVQWAEAVCRVRDRIVETEAAQMAVMMRFPPDMSLARSCGAATRAEHDFFANAAAKLIAYRIWASELGVFAAIDFSGLDAFDRQDISDLRNMREHVTEYFGRPNHKGVPGGRDRDRWMKAMAEGAGDASSSIGTLIGNRLDYAAFADAVAAILPALKQAPIPYPPAPGMPPAPN